MNTHHIHGRLTKDPEFHPGETEKKDRCNFSVAVDRRFGDETDFFDCVIFGKRASVIEKYFGRGSEIVLEGEGHINSYTDKDGNKRRSYSVVVADFDFCGSKRNESSGSVDELENEARAALMPEDVPDSFEAQEEDVPF
jgi:single-strand DNA-binding protein